MEDHKEAAGRVENGGKARTGAVNEMEELAKRSLGSDNYSLDCVTGWILNIIE